MKPIQFSLKPKLTQFFLGKKQLSIMLLVILITMGLWFSLDYFYTSPSVEESIQPLSDFIKPSSS